MKTRHCRQPRPRWPPVSAQRSARPTAATRRPAHSSHARGVFPACLAARRTAVATFSRRRVRQTRPVCRPLTLGVLVRRRAAGVLAKPPRASRGARSPRVQQSQPAAARRCIKLVVEPTVPAPGDQPNAAGTSRSPRPEATPRSPPEPPRRARRSKLPRCVRCARSGGRSILTNRAGEALGALRAPNDSARSVLEGSIRSGRSPRSAPSEPDRSFNARQAAFTQRHPALEAATLRSSAARGAIEAAAKSRPVCGHPQNADRGGHTIE